MRRFFADLDRRFEEFGWNWPTLEKWVEATWMPRLDAFERDGMFTIRTDLPGLSREDVTVEVTDEGVTITGERKREEKEEHEGLYRAERRYGSFSRQVPLPEGAEIEKAAATFQDGVLEVSVPVPRRPARPGRRLEIR